jgi:nucleoside phosphorylase
MTIDLVPYLKANGFLRLDYPPRLWQVDVDDVALVRMMGAMIAAALARGAALGDVYMRANNVEADVDADDEQHPGSVPPGHFVALTVESTGDWRPEVACRPSRKVAGDASLLVNPDLDAAATAAGVEFAYTRSDGETGSVTMFLPAAR